ncbi:MAG: sulfotransferase [Rudaea sp.]|uniref:tetratricopeptide repeat-containing sulfotransferase family protein n=1 Tax=Rudaea sp. TaxID=2136325 RepID=UPI0039E3B4CF
MQQAVDSPNQELQRGYALLGEGRTAEALQLAASLAAAHADNARVLLFASEAHSANGEPEAALPWIDRAVAASGGHPSLKLAKVRVLLHLRRRSEAAALAAEAAQASTDGGVVWQAGKLLNSCNRLDQAVAQYERARSLAGDHPGLLYDLAVARFFHGDFEQAERDLDRVLELQPQAGHALYRRATLRTQTRERNHVADIDRRLTAGIREPAHEAWALYALGKELEDLGQYEASFVAFAAGARKQRGTLAQYDVAEEVDAQRALREAWTAAVMARPDAGCADDGAIFIVGMPRSGTTLVERLLVQSGQVRSAGEMPDFANLFGMAAQRRVDEGLASTSAQASTAIDFAALGREYVRGAREAADGSARFIDKTPFNYLYCGPIAKALPDARILHLTRDPLDACYAVFKTLFFSTWNFSYDLDELAEYYIAYRETMRHWHEVMPGRILEVAYENLVSDTGNQARRIYEWCGLEWNPQALAVPQTGQVAFKTASAAQVREPVHQRSVSSAQRHRERLAPLIRKLAAAGILKE